MYLSHHEIEHPRKYCAQENIVFRKILRSGKYCAHENIALRKTLRPGKYCAQENIAPHENIVLWKILGSGNYCAQENKENKIKANNFNIRSLSSFFEKGGSKHRKTKD